MLILVKTLEARLKDHENIRNFREADLYHTYCTNKFERKLKRRFCS